MIEIDDTSAANVIFRSLSKREKSVSKLTTIGTCWLKPV